MFFQRSPLQFGLTSGPWVLNTPENYFAVSSWRATVWSICGCSQDLSFSREELLKNWSTCRLFILQWLSTMLFVELSSVYHFFPRSAEQERLFKWGVMFMNPSCVILNFIPHSITSTVVALMIWFSEVFQSIHFKGKIASIASWESYSSFFLPTSLRKKFLN